MPDNRHRHAMKDTLAWANFKLHGSRHGVYVRVIVLIRSRLERPGADGILGTQPEMHRERFRWSDGVEVKNGLRRREAELFQPSTLQAGGFLHVGLQVFSEQVKSRRNAQVH